VVWTPARVLFQGKQARPELRCPGVPQMNTTTSSPRERSITIYTASPKQCHQCFGTGRSTVEFHQPRPILWLGRLLFVLDEEKDRGCYESASCFENVALWRQQHESFRLPVLLEVDSKEYSDPVVESTGEERKKNISTFFLGFLITKSSKQCIEDSPSLFNQAETLMIESLC